jgi:hypothetical protein
MRTAAATIAVAVALSAIAGCGDSKTGLRVSIDPGEFKNASSMKVAVSVSKGFQMQAGANMGGALVTTEDFDGDGLLDLLVNFNGTFPNTVSFRIDTANTDTQAVHVTALAFNGQMNLIAGGDAAGSLPAGSEGVVAFKLTAQTGPVGADTRTTDLKTATADVTIKGRRVNGHLGPIAVCDVNGDDKQDLIIGAPDDDDSRMLGAVGSLNIVFGGGGNATIDLTSAAVGQETHFFGVEGGDHLGAAVACAELNGDTFDDIVVGAPSAGGGTGRVYVIYGRTGLATNTINLTATNPQDGASVKFASALANAHLGSALFAGDLDGDPSNPGQVMMAAPGPNARRVHLFANLPVQGATQAIDVDAPTSPHVMYTGVSATALAAGDLDGAGAHDIVLADRNFVPTGTIRARGVVYVLPGVDPASSATIDIATASPMLTLSGAADGSLLGSAVLVANTSGRGGDLIVGATGDGDDAGRVYLYQHEADFFVSPIRANADGMLTGPITGGQFGAALAASGPPGSARLLVGAPGTDRAGRNQAGAAYVFVGNQDRQFRMVDQVFGAAAQDHLGSFVAGGFINGDQIGDLVTSAPDATGSDSGSGVTYVRVGR